MPAPTPPRLRILLIEDQRDIAANIWDFMERRGHEMDHCIDGVAGLERALKHAFDVIILDLGLPRMDGLELCRRLRAAGHGVPVLMLTARDTLEDILRGFAEGADDYLVKPFAMRELEARIRVLTRADAPAVAAQACGPLHFDPATLVAQREGRQVTLTRLQAAILGQLMSASPRIVSHDALIQSAWAGREANTAALQTQVYELRALLDKPFAQPMLQAVRGVGYRLVPPA